MVSRSYPREHQQLRRIEYPARQDDLFRRPKGLGPAEANALDTDGAVTFHHNPGRRRADAQLNIAPSHGRPEKRRRRAVPSSLADIRLTAPEPLLFFAVVIFRIADSADLPASIHASHSGSCDLANWVFSGPPPPRHVSSPPSQDSILRSRAAHRHKTSRPHRCRPSGHSPPDGRGRKP